MNVPSSHLPPAAFVSIRQRWSLFAMPALPWLLVLTPTLTLLASFGTSVWTELSAKQDFLSKNPSTEVNSVSVAPTTLNNEQTDFTVTLNASLVALRDRQNFYGEPNEPRVMSAISRDSEPLYALIEESIDDEQRAELIGAALLSERWLLDANFFDAQSRDDVDAMEQTLSWSAKLAPSKPDVRLLDQRHEWVDTLVRLPLRVPSSTLRNVDALVLQSPVDIESSLSSVVENVARQVTYFQEDRVSTFTDLGRMQADVAWLGQNLDPRKILAQDPDKLIRPSAKHPFDLSRSPIEQRFDVRKSYFDHFARLLKLEDERRRLRIGIAVRIQSNSTGKASADIGELTLAKLTTPLTTTSIWGSTFQITLNQSQAPNHRQSVSIHTADLPPDAGTTKWYQFASKRWGDRREVTIPVVAADLPASKN